MDTLLITGGSGYLGKHLCRHAAETHPVHTTFFHNKTDIAAGTPHLLDVTDAEAVRALVVELSPAAIIHCAAINPGQGNDRRMFAVNHTGTANIAAAAAKIGARLVHVSTDMVHAGTDAPYPPDAPPTPITPYGESKAAAETAIAEIYPAAAIVRTSLIYGLTEPDRGTAGFARRLAAGGTLTLFTDQIRQPVWVETLTKALLALAVDFRDISGIFNVAGRQALSRAEFGQKMLDWWQIAWRDHTTFGHAADLPHPSPLDLRLDVSKAENLLGMDFPGVDDVLHSAAAKTSG